MSIETLTRAANSTDLAMEEGVVHDVDRVAAMAGGNTLGGLLFRYAQAEQPQWGVRIVYLLARRARERTRIGREIAQRVAAAALLEFARPHCLVCNGATQRVVDKQVVVCAGCSGLGRRRFTNEDRRELVGVYGRRIDEAFALCHEEMTNSLGAFLGHTYGRLE